MSNIPVNDVILVIRGLILSCSGPRKLGPFTRCSKLNLDCSWGNTVSDFNRVLGEHHYKMVVC